MIGQNYLVVIYCEINWKKNDGTTILYKQIISKPVGPKRYIASLENILSILVVLFVFINVKNNKQKTVLKKPIYQWRSVEEGQLIHSWFSYDFNNNGWKFNEKAQK